MEYLEINNVTKIYQTNADKVEALHNVSFSAKKGELVVILGESGAGKTTLLNLLGGMDNVTSGSIILDNKDISKLNKKDLCEYRRHDVGFVFQFYNLVNNLTAKENVELALEITKDALNPDTILDKVNLSERKNNFPSELSGGEQQRVSIARAVAKNPKILLCDEPTGALDFKTGIKILELLYNLAREEKRLVIIVTHNQIIKHMADKVIYIRSGEIIKTVTNAKPLSPKDIEW